MGNGVDNDNDDDVDYDDDNNNNNDGGEREKALANKASACSLCSMAPSYSLISSAVILSRIQFCTKVDVAATQT